MAKSTLHPRLWAAPLLLFAWPAHGGELRYAAPWHEAGWKTSASRSECRLVQEIPYYGSAAFVRRAGHDLSFTLNVRQYATHATVAQLQSLPPAWFHTVAARNLGEVPIAKGDTPLVVEGDGARQLLAELQQGMWPTVTYQDGGTQQDRVVVAVSAINLQPSLPPFLDCLHDLLPADFNDVRRSTVNFGLASTSLDPDDRQRLARMAEYARADDKVKGFRVVGHADSTGLRRYNSRLSRKRAEAVRAHLLALGVPAAKIEINYQGERRPRASNASDDGRTVNRRVEVTLLR